jgi:hypothetical protein
MNQQKLSNQLIYIVAAMALLAALALSGCGGDDDDGTTAAGNTAGTTQSESPATNEAPNSGREGDGAGGDQGSVDPAKEEFIAEADALCKKTRGRSRREILEYLDGERGKPSTMYEEAADNVLIPQLEGLIQEIQSLSTPSSAEEAADALVVGWEQVIEAAEANPAQFAQESPKEVLNLEATAEQEGFAVCGPIA